MPSCYFLLCKEALPQYLLLLIQIHNSSLPNWGISSSPLTQNLLIFLHIFILFPFRVFNSFVCFHITFMNKRSSADITLIWLLYSFSLMFVQTRNRIILLVRLDNVFRLMWNLSNILRFSPLLHFSSPLRPVRSLFHILMMNCFMRCLILNLRRLNWHNFS